jgi:hypothetical protein
MPIFSLMTELSPAALAIRDAAEKQTDLDFRYAPAIAAAVLEAAADQVVPDQQEPATWPDMDISDTLISHTLWLKCRVIRRQLLAIAAELKAHG